MSQDLYSVCLHCDAFSPVWFPMCTANSLVHINYRCNHCLCVGCLIFWCLPSVWPRFMLHRLKWFLTCRFSHTYFHIPLRIQAAVVYMHSDALHCHWYSTFKSRITTENLCDQNASTRSAPKMLKWNTVIKWIYGLEILVSGNIVYIYIWIILLLIYILWDLLVDLPVSCMIFIQIVYIEIISLLCALAWVLIISQYM